MMTLLSSTVVYTLMLADVEEQTYMFAMMRALGFRLNHIIGFVSLQAFTFSIPGMLIGLAIAYVLNCGVKVFLFNMFGNYLSYQMSWVAIIFGIVCIGVCLPLISTIGPTRLALGKNLRTSLDSTRRNNTVADEVSVTVKRLKDVSLSLNEVCFGLILTGLGFVVYVFIPAALIRQNMTMFFLILNLILVLITVGLTFVATIVLPPLQIAILKLIMFLNGGNRCLESITRKRLESMRSRNVKISLMITGAISFLMFQAGAYLSSNDVFQKLWEFIIAGDITVRGYLDTVYLHEIPLSNYLEEQKEKDNAVLSYSYFGFDLDQICDLQRCTYLGSGSSTAGNDEDGSNVHVYLYSVDENYLETTYNYYYRPSEVSNSTSYTFTDDWWSKPDAIKALYSFDSYARQSKDEIDIVNNNMPEESQRRRPVAKIPILVSEGLRGPLSLDTEANKNAVIDIKGQKYEAEVVGLIAKMPGTAMTAVNSGKNKITLDMEESSFSFGRSVITTHSAMRSILEEEAARDPKVKEKLDFLNSQYEFRDGIPKGVVHIKVSDELSQERYDEVIFGIG